MKYEAIIFDLDGTLVDSIPLYEEAFLYMVDAAKSSMTSEQFRRAYENNLHLSNAMKLLNIKEPEQKMRSIRDEYYCELLRTKIEWFPDTKALLDALPKEYPKAMMTGSWLHYVDAIQNRLPLPQYLKPIVTAEDFVPNIKPDPKGLLIATELLGVQPDNCLYVGDQAFDAETAKRAGMASCLVKRKIYTPENAGDDADIVVESLEELIGMF